MEQRYSHRTLAENILIFAIGLLALAVLVASFFPLTRMSSFLMHLLEMKKMTARLFSVVLLIVLYHLYGRRRAAWYVTCVLLALALARHLIPPVQPVFLAAAVLDGAALALLIAFRSDFCCPSERRSLRRSLLLLLFAAAGIVCNAGISYHFVKSQLAGAPGRVLLWDSFAEALDILFGTTNSNAPGFPSVWFENFLFWFSWGCMLLALLAALRPWIERFLWTEKDMQRARQLVLRYGQNPSSYLTLEEDKLLYFSRCAPGVIPYGIVGKTVVVNGDPVCAPEDFPAVLAEFREFCRRSSHELIFMSVTDRFLEVYRAQGFAAAKSGEEAWFDLQTYDLAGKKGAKMRMNIHHAARAGLTVREYRPLEHRDPGVERAMNDISREWLQGKKSGLLTFTIGSVGLERPLDKRYFYACGPDGRICAFNVYCPYGGGTGYMADITRRSPDAPGGATELITYEAMQVFRQEGIRTLSLGLAPLANLVQEDQRPSGAEKLLNFVYEHLNACYDFKSLYRAKESYSPTEWAPEYFAWTPRIPSPGMLYAVVRIQNRQGLGDFARAFLRGLRS